MKSIESNKAVLLLADGTAFYGKSAGKKGITTGEICFNTGMTGYQEVFTDPSYFGQILVMTNAHIGNYGVNDEDVESGRIHVKALLVKEYQEYPSNWRSQRSLADYLKADNIPGLEGIDTRALTRHIRLKGAMKAALSTLDLDPDSLVEKARQSPDMAGQDHSVSSGSVNELIKMSDFRNQAGGCLRSAHLAGVSG